jgi:hypothetical protein
MKLAVALQVMEASETHVALLTHIGLFLTVSQQVTLQVMVSREDRVAVRAFVLLCRA